MLCYFSHLRCGNMAIEVQKYVRLSKQSERYISIENNFKLVIYKYLIGITR